MVNQHIAKPHLFFFALSPQYQKSVDFATTLELMENQEGAPALKNALKTVARSVTDSGISQQKMINVLESNILCQFGNYSHGIKAKRIANKAREAAYKNLVKVHGGWQKASSKNTGQQTLQKKRNAYEAAMKYRQRALTIASHPYFTNLEFLGKC